MDEDGNETREPCEYDRYAHGDDGEETPDEGETDARYLCRQCVNAENDHTCESCRIDDDEAADGEANDDDADS